MDCFVQLKSEKAFMSPPASPRRDEHSVPDCSKGQDDADCSPWKQLKDHDGRNYSYTDTASLTCSDSLNSSLTDTDEETCSLSPDNSLKTRHTRLSPLPRAGELARNLHVIEDMSFDSEYSMTEEKLHEPSSQQKCENRRRRLVWMLPLAMVGLVCYRFYPPARRIRVDPQDWKHFLQYEAPQVRKLIETSPIPHAFTVKLTGSRSDLLERSVEVLTRCAPVEEVQVEWQSTMRPPRKLFRHASNKVVLFERLSNNAVLLLDEDVIFTCDELERGKNHTVNQFKLYIHCTVVSNMSFSLRFPSVATQLGPHGWFLSVSSRSTVSAAVARIHHLCRCISNHPREWKVRTYFKSCGLCS